MSVSSAEGQNVLKRPTMRQVFSAIVILMWAVSFIADLVNPNYDPPEYVNPLIMLVGAYLFATSTPIKDVKDKNAKDKDKA